VILFPLMKPEFKNEDAPVLQQVETTPIETWSVPPLPTKDQALALTNTYLKDTLRHCQQVWQVMQYFAKKLGQDEHYRYVVWLLHDIDRDHIGKLGDKHLKDEFDSIIDSLNLEDATQLKQDIRSHGPYLTWVEPTTLLQKYLISIDELSGLIYAYSLMRPEWLNGIEWSSLNKKIKDKKFAAWVDREHVKNCETYLGVPLAEFAMEVIEAMK
jgi:predicted hydrolase (HD superfamily)